MGQRLRVPRWKEGNTLHVSCDQIYTSSSIQSRSLLSLFSSVRIHHKLPSKHISNYKLLHYWDFVSLSRYRKIIKSSRIPRDRFSPTQLIIITLNFTLHSNNICFWNNARCSKKYTIIYHNPWYINLIS